MAGFYRGAVGDSFRAIGLAMVTTAEPETVPDEAIEQPTYRDAFENPLHTDFALTHRMSMVPCGCCDCPGCYDCTPGRHEPCGCEPDNGLDLNEAAI